MKSALRKIFNQGSPVPYAAPGRFSLAQFSGENAIETALRTYATAGTVFSIVHLLSSSVALPEWSLYRKQPQDGRRRYTTSDVGVDQRVQVVNHAALSLLQNPNDFQTTTEFIECSQQFMDLVGECFWVIDRAGSGFPVSMWIVSPAHMDVIPSPDNYIQGYVYKGPSGEKIPLDLDQVIHTKLANPMNPYRGVGPVQSVLTNIDAMRYSAEYNRNFFLNGASPDGVIQVPNRLSEAEWDEFTERWRESHMGVSRAHRVAVLENGMTWMPNALSHRDMEFQLLVEENRDLIREAFGMHKSMLGTVEDVNRANAQTSEEVFGAWMLLPRLDRWKSTLNYRLLPMFGSTGVGVEFDYANPLPDDREADNFELTAKATAAQTLVNAGYDPDDVLETVGLPAMGQAEKATQQPALPPGWVAAPPAAPASSSASGNDPDHAGETGSGAVTNRLLMKKDTTAKVVKQLASDFPAPAMAWVYHAVWTGPVNVPENHIDPNFDAFDPASPDRVDHFVRELEAGNKLPPVILVKRPGEPKLLMVDGHHRFIAETSEGQSVRAYIATVDSDHGPWESMHVQQLDGPNALFGKELHSLFINGFVNGKEVLNGHRS